MTSGQQSYSYQEFQTREAEVGSRRPLRLLAVFLLLFFVFQYGWEMSRDTALERLVVHDATVRPAVWVIGQLSPGSGIEAQGFRMVSPQGRLNILNGCEGLETLFLLLAALLAYPLRFGIRLRGIALGVLLVFVLNQARIVMLWYAFLYDRAVFGALHGVVLPLLMVAACLVFYLLFLARHASERT